MKPTPQGWGNVPTRIEPALDGPSVAEAEVDTDLSELIGCQVGNYVIERPLARGGMAVVYLAKHPGLGREVAVKLLSPEYQNDVDLNRRFLQEARVTAGFRHPHIVEIYDLGELDGRAYYTMERLIGVDLASQIAKQGRFSPVEVAAYLAQICSALDVAHQIGVVHRDLKPANVFVVNEDPLHLKLMDFGIAKVREARAVGGTRRGEVLGTPAYMAPEQALGQVDAISVATDIYALGIIAYEMLTGSLPFVADSDLLLLTMHVRETPRPIRELAPHVPQALAELVERCLAKEPAQRPASVLELSVALDRCSLDAPDAPSSIAPARLLGPAPVTPQRSVARRLTAARQRAFNRPKAVLAPVPIEPSAEPEAAEAPEEPEAPAPRAPTGPFEVVAASPSLLLSEITDGEESGDGRPLTLTPDDGRVLDRLLRRMQRTADFPSFLNNVTEISRKADADAAFSARDVSESILKDFALTAKLLRMVNGLFGARFGGRVFSVNQAVLILGFDSVRSMALGVSVYKTAGKAGKGGRFHEELADESINSLISGEIARILAPRAGIKDTELAMMCAMFRNLGQQLVMEYLPEEYEKIIALSAQQRQSRAAAAQRVLGTTLPKLGIGVAERWCLPKMMRAAMSSNPKPDAILLRDEDKLGALAKLSNDLCHIIASGERHNYKVMIQRLLAMHKQLLKLQDQDITALLGTVCKSFESRYSSLFGPYHRKSRFLFHASGMTGQQKPVERRERPPLSEEDIAHIEQRAQTLTLGFQKRQAPDGLLGEALTLMAETLDTPRVILLTQTSDRKEIEVRLAVGADAKAIKGQFKVALGPGSDVFSSTLRSGKNTVIADALGPAAMRRVPQRYFEVIGSAAFALYVCASRGYPTALLLVDADAAESLPSRERVTATKSLRELVAKIAERS